VTGGHAGPARCRSPGEHRDLPAGQDDLLLPCGEPVPRRDLLARARVLRRTAARA